MSYCNRKLQVNSVGSEIELTLTDYDCETETETAIDISGSFDRQIVIVKPDGSSFSKIASFSTDGLDGKMFITTEENDLDIEGTYKIQGKVSIGLWSGSTSIGTFDVEGNL